MYGLGWGGWWSAGHLLEGVSSLLVSWPKKGKKKKRLQGWTSAYFCIYYTVIGRDLGYTIVKFSSNGTGLDTRVSHQSFSV